MLAAPHGRRPDINTVAGGCCAAAPITASTAEENGGNLAQQLNDGFADKGMLQYSATPMAPQGHTFRAPMARTSPRRHGPVASAAATGTSTNGKEALNDVTATDFANVAKTTDELVETINATTALQDKVRASNDNGKLRVENLSTQQLNVTGASGGNITGLINAKSTVDGNQSRADFAEQFNELRDQLDKLSDDASFNGVNLLRGDNLKITFNETGTSAIEIQSKDGDAINSTNLDVETTLTPRISIAAKRSTPISKTSRTR